MLMHRAAILNCELQVEVLATFQVGIPASGSIFLWANQLGPQGVWVLMEHAPIKGIKRPNTVPQTVGCRNFWNQSTDPYLNDSATSVHGSLVFTREPVWFKNCLSCFDPELGGSHMCLLSGQLCFPRRLCKMSGRLAGSHVTGSWSLTRRPGSGFPVVCVWS